MKNNCNIPRKLDLSLVTRVSFIIFIITIISNFIIALLIYKSDFLTANFINLIIVIIWIVFVLIYSKCGRYFYIKKLYQIKNHPCDRILKEILIFLADITSSDNHFDMKKLKKYIENNLTKKKIKERIYKILVKDLLKKLIEEGEIEFFQESDKKTKIYG